MSTIATCDATVLSALLTNQNIQQCSTDSGYEFTTASIPTQNVIDLMCASTSCRDLLNDAQALNLSECILPVGANIRLRADLIDYVPARCASATGSAAGSIATESSMVGGQTASPNNTVTMPPSAATSMALSAMASGESSAAADETSPSAAASASAALSPPDSSAAASPVGRAMGLISIAALAVATCCL